MARLRISFKGFQDPILRPRYIIWTVVVVLIVVGVMVPVLGITSTRWFCANSCHKVQDDTIKSYEHSTHANISCMACHMPVNANPIIFLMHKAEALGELVQTLTNNYSLPLNANDEVALTMSEEQCTQCHDPSKRIITPTAGIKINHEVHTANDVTCPTCHNRVAHNENFDMTLKDPKTGKPNQKHVNFMQMTACFRCHTQDLSARNAPPGACSACHTPEFPLIPVSHRAPGFFPKGHGVLAAKEESRVVQAGGESWINAPQNAKQTQKAAETNGTLKKEKGGEDLQKVQTINLCSTCHPREFCTGCHGVPMPHPADFQKNHAAYGKADPTVCAKCHGLGVDFCNNCHHGTTLGYTIKPNVTWKAQHPLAVAQTGAAACFQCHNPTFCAVCHVNGGTLPKNYNPNGP